MSGDPEQEYFADGMVEEIITALSRIRWLFVIARNSSFTYKGQAVDVKQVGRELGVRYVLEGSVRKAGQRVRITGQLIDAVTGTHLWADRFDGSLEDVFELQDKVASSVAGVIEPALQDAEMRHSAARPTTDLTAYDLYLRALAVVPSSTLEALRLLEHAIERAEDLARRALQVSGDDPGVLANAAFVLAYFSEDIAAMMALVDRALVLNSSYARGWHISGNLRLWAGHLDRAIEHIEASLRFSPRTRVGIRFMVIGAAHFLSRRFDEAILELLLGLQEFPNHAPLNRCLAACYAHMGRLDEARAVIARLRAINPVIVPSIVPYRNPAHRDFLLSGLRLAAGEAT